MSPRETEMAWRQLPASQSPYSSTVSCCRLAKSWADGEERRGGGAGGSLLGLLLFYWTPIAHTQNSSHRTVLTACQPATLCEVRGLTRTKG